MILNVIKLINTIKLIKNEISQLKKVNNPQMKQILVSKLNQLFDLKKVLCRFARTKYGANNPKLNEYAKSQGFGNIDDLISSFGGFNSQQNFGTSNGFGNSGSASFGGFNSQQDFGTSNGFGNSGSSSFGGFWGENNSSYKPFDGRKK